MEATLQSIFQSSFSAYAKVHRLPLKDYQAAQAIMTCRTPLQGGHVQRCPDGHESHIQYHSCRHRSCPKCNALPKAEWAQAQYQRLLATDHYHVIFTLPHELLPLWRFNRRWFAHTLFTVVRDTLMTLSQDERHLGALPGVVLSLHTWGRNLSLHPHIHCLITGGGLGPDGHWRALARPYLFPSRVIRKLYRGKLLSSLWHALQGGELALPPGTDGAAQGHCFRALGRKKWNVCIQPPYAHGRGVMGYLARYIKGGPLTDQRITQASDSAVRFAYTDHRDGQRKSMVLPKHQFMARILEHVYEPRQHVIRHYGLYGHQAKAKRALCRAQLGQPPERAPAPVNWQDFIKDCSDAMKGVCSRCKKPLVRGLRLGKNSISKVGGRSYVQQDVRADLSTWSLERSKPPGGEVFFFGSERPLN